MQELDPTTGKVKWTQKFDKGWRVEHTYSLDPLVVYSTNEDKKAWNISTITASGKFRSQVAFDEDFAPECGWGFLGGDLQACQGVAADADTLYLPTEASTGANEIVAINLASGKEKWRVKSPAAETMLPLKTEGGKLVAYVEPSYDSGGRIVSIPTTGATAHADDPAADARGHRGDRERLLLEGHRLGRRALLHLDHAAGRRRRQEGEVDARLRQVTLRL